jgi:hypothetical protein
MTPRSLRTNPVKMENSEDPDRKCRILRDKELRLNREKSDVKGLYPVGGILWKSREATTSEGGRGLGQSGPRPAGLAHFEAQLPPLDLAASQTIYSPLAESHGRIDSSSAAEEQRSMRHTISERRVMLII